MGRLFVERPSYCARPFAAGPAVWLASFALAACGDDGAADQAGNSLDTGESTDSAIANASMDSGQDTSPADIAHDPEDQDEDAEVDDTEVDAGEGSDASAGPPPVDYANTANWLCHPALSDDPCDADHSYTVVDAEGSGELVEHVVAADPAVDCFYVYPTASADATPNSDMRAGVEEAFVARTQVGPLNAVCRVFAPLYRQVTLTALLGLGSRGESDRELAYNDVLGAWRHYLEHENNGRGVLLVGHSQGTSHLRRLIAEEMEPDEATHDLLVAAYLFGGTIEVPVGADVGGSFASTPVCRDATETGCVLSYATFSSDAPPPADAYFGTASAGNVAVCNHPASLDGGASTVDGRYPTRIDGLFGIAAGSEVSPYADPSSHAELSTGNFATPGLVSAQCVVRDGFSYLEVSLTPSEGDVRLTEFAGQLGPSWGLHLMDVFVVMNDLIALASRQSEAWLARQETLADATD